MRRNNDELQFLKDAPITMLKRLRVDWSRIMKSRDNSQKRQTIVDMFYKNYLNEIRYAIEERADYVLSYCQAYLLTAEELQEVKDKLSTEAIAIAIADCLPPLSKIMARTEALMVSSITRVYQEIALYQAMEEILQEYVEMVG